MEPVFGLVVLRINPLSLATTIPPPKLLLQVENGPHTLTFSCTQVQTYFKSISTLLCALCCCCCPGSLLWCVGFSYFRAWAPERVGSVIAV